MKIQKTQRLEAGRNIRFQLSSFVSIVVIAMLAVTVYLGIAYSARAMDENVSRYYNQANMQDLQVFSPAFLTEDDVAAIRALDGVEDVEECRETVAWVPTDSGSINVSATSLLDRIAVPEILEGRAPQNDKECMIEDNLAAQTGLKVGDTIRLLNKSGGTAPMLKDTDFTVTGIFTHCDHVTDKIDVTPYVMLTDDAFDDSILRGGFTRVRISLKDMPENRFTNAYFQATAPTVQGLKALSDERMPIRIEEVRETYGQEITDAENKLAEAQTKLDEAAQQLNEGAARLSDGEKEIKEGEKKLQDAEQQIADGEQQLSDAEQQLNDGEQQLQDAEQQIADGEQQLQDAEQQIADGEQQLQDAEQQIKDGEQQLQDAEQQIADGEQQLQDAEQQIADGEQQLQDAEKQIADGEQQLQDAEQQIADGEQQLQDAEQKIADGEQQLEDGEKKLEQVKADNADGLAKYEQGLKDLADAERRLGLAPGQLAEGEKKLSDSKIQLDHAHELLQHAENLVSEIELIHDDPRHRSDEEIESFARDAIDFVKTNFQGDEEIAVNAVRTFLESLGEEKPSSMEEAYRILDRVLRDGLNKWEQQYREKLAEWERGRIDYYYSGEEYLDGMIAYEKGKKELNEAADAIQRLQDAEQELEEKKEQLENARQEVIEKRAELENGKQEFNEKKAELESGKQEFNEKKAELESAKQEFNEKKAELENGKQEFNEKKAELESAKQQLNEKKAELESAKQEFNEKKAELESGKQEFSEKKAEFESKKQEFNEKKEELENAKQMLADSRQALEDGKKQQEDGQREYEENQKKYEQGVSDYRENREKLNQFEKQMDILDTITWTVLNNRSNGGFVYAKENSANLSSLSSTFSLLFIAIAALVIYASVARMVDEQSVLVGTTKAMGFYKYEIMFKYLLFGLLSTLLGIIAGILIAYFVLQTLCLNMYAPYYSIPKAPRCFLVAPTVLMLVGGAALALAAVLFASHSLMKSSSVELMKGKEPKAKQGKGKSAKSSGTLYSRLILLNMRSDLTRVIVTVVSVAGCCILLMVGFTLKFGQDRIIDRQYGEVLTFDAELSFDPDNPEAANRLKKMLDRKGIEYALVYQDSSIFSDGDDLSACTLICAEPDALPGWYNLRDMYNIDTVAESEHGVLITKRMHETYALNEGDSVTFFNSAMVPAVGVVSGIFNNYFGQIVFASPDAYHEIFGSDSIPNCFFLKLNGNDITALRHDAAKIAGFLKLSDAASRRTQIENTAKAMNVLIILMIVLAGLMAWFILDNLSGSYMIHKKKELTVMRVNGFTTGECIRYAATELVITTVLGILIGVPVGAWLGYRVIRLTEQSFLQMDRTLDVRTVIFSVLITAVFALVINGIALSKVKNLKLSDAAN